MPRPRPHRDRRRPGRRPPHRYAGGRGSSRPAGFTPPGLDALYRLLMPGYLHPTYDMDFFTSPYFLLFARLCVGGVFVISGVGKWLDKPGTEASMSKYLFLPRGSGRLTALSAASPSPCRPRRSR